MTTTVPQLDEGVRITAKDFFERLPPGERAQVERIGTRHAGMHSRYWVMEMPTLELHCATDKCSGTRFFSSQAEPCVEPKKTTSHFVTYACKNCGQSFKTFAFRAALDEDGCNGELHKFGECPPFGPATPSRLITMLGGERDYYLKGRRSENQGLGIAAFAYYRRVIENQKNRILDEVVRVATKLGAPTEMLNDFSAAKAEMQFSRAVGSIRHGIPQALLVDGHNPLLLLHSALSEGLHAQTDAECLGLATSIRVVLTELVERMATALKEEAELKSAVSRLLTVKANTAAK
jgi:hypothetical protein